MNTTATIKLYEMLRVKLGEEESRGLVEQFMEAIQEESRQNRDMLWTATGPKKRRGGLFRRMAESRSVMIKWMFIFWIGGIGLMTSLFMAVVKGLTR